MSIKEEVLKLQHYFIMKDGKIRYLCNQACSVTKGKYTNDYFKVTCKNCKEELVRDRIRIAQEETKQKMIEEFKEVIDKVYFDGDISEFKAQLKKEAEK